uniref:Fucolectin tachylectin-4 pentraxin-1 domain-containing protein n=1 Tax=Latimeria chalumnae TaxID=7897 RepID=M3XJY4_LATCH|nr:PREDICTED: pentraxin fusion protein-like [Latimeria chalumnae]|eukprot:XP_014344331.1 PREDICTED: pentraxin fusion protein-like [Latimeria chalumnae]
MSPWWRVDLQEPYVISAVAITNGGDCCWEHLRGAELYIGSSLKKNGTLNPRCASIYPVEKGSTDSFCCNGMVGRYVTIAIPTREEYLILCEVEIYGVPAVNRCPGNQTGIQTNVGLKGIATQSSVEDRQGVPEHAIDGNMNNVYSSLSCTHTRFEMGPWWRVDLQEPHKISAVVITNQRDCCWECLKGAEIRIGNSLVKNGTLNPRCASITIVAKGSTDPFCCNGMIGCYVTITIPMHKYLTLCEVRVYGLPVQSTCVRNPHDRNVALMGIATQSSKRDQLGVPEHAIDGNKNSDFGYLSCTHMEHEMGPWWRVDLQQPYRISAVVITN